MSEKERELDLLLSAMLDPSAEEFSAPEEVDGEALSLLQVAVEIRKHFAPEGPDESFLKNSEIRIKNRMRALQRGEESPARERSHQRRSIWRQLLRPIPVLVSLLLVLALTFGAFGVSGAAAASLPGDLWYPVKRGFEQVQLAATFSEEGDARLLASFAEERVDEIEALTSNGRYQDVDQAVEGYLSVTEELSELAENSGAAAEQLNQVLANNVEALERVHEQVPPQAQAAIERAIERTRNRQERRDQGSPENPGQGAGERPTDLPVPDENRSAQPTQDMHLAEQIANQYDQTVESVLNLYEEICQEDWQCVREHYRNQEAIERTAEQIARQYAVPVADVLEIYNGTCQENWPCVRAHFRDPGPPGQGQGPPDNAGQPDDPGDSTD
ncbi:MAG: DUF5667 domain-containing protein [Anaerolineales bacterium]